MGHPFVLGHCAMLGLADMVEHDDDIQGEPPLESNAGVVGWQGKLARISLARRPHLRPANAMTAGMPTSNPSPNNARPGTY